MTAPNEDQAKVRCAWCRRWFMAPLHAPTACECGETAVLYTPGRFTYLPTRVTGGPASQEEIDLNRWMLKVGGADRGAGS